jgi:hypothetical protein
MLRGPRDNSLLEWGVRTPVWPFNRGGRIVVLSAFLWLVPQLFVEGTAVRSLLLNKGWHGRRCELRSELLVPGQLV